jgi:hypothetical protein
MPRRAYAYRAVLAATALGSAALATVALPQAATNSSVTVAIDASANRHAINPLVYGVSYGSAAQLSELRTPLVRLGGNNTSRYNWQVNADNRAADWYFESVPAESGSSTAGEVGDTFISNAKSAGAQPMLTFPILGWVAKLGSGRSKLASFSINKYGAQTDADWSWFPDAGNGVRTSGGFVTGNDPNDANVPNSTSLQQQWAQHLVQRWGNASGGGLRYYILDNEYSIWQETHRDVQPTGARMDEIRDLMVNYAAAIKSVDSGAQIVGPEEWGWSGFKVSGYDQQYGKTYGWGYLPDQSAHGGVWYLPYLLDQIRQASASRGMRLLDVLTVHWYPQSGEFGNDTSQSMQLMRNRSTRALWDPSYVDPTWINDTVQLIPRLHNWVNSYYPGTKIGITEYNWGADGHINGATAQADIFGIFGREGLDVGARWVIPDASTPTYKAIKMWRNYDNSGGAFGDTSVKASVPNPDELSAFAAVRGDGALTVMVINKVLWGSTPVTLSLGGFNPGGSASAWQLTSANSINRLGDMSVSGGSVSLTVPSQSITMVVIPGNGGAPAPSPTPTPTPTPAPTPAPTPTPPPPPGGGGRQTYGNNGNPWAISASGTTRIEAENFDQGGEGVAYHDHDATNNGGGYRNEGVDLEWASGGSYNIGWFTAPEWVEYTVNVAAAGNYNLRLHVARLLSGSTTANVLFGGADKTGTLSIPSTGGWQTYTDVNVTVSLSAGTQVVRVVNGDSYFNLDYFELTPSSGTPTPPPSGGQKTYGNGGNPWPIGGGTSRIEAENFDQGGEGVAYHDNDGSNNGGSYRNEGVDLEWASGGSYDVGWIIAGEWLEYTVNVASAGNYDVKLHVARNPWGDSAVKLLFGGVDKTGDIAVPSTGGWQNWTDVTKTVSLSAGTQVMKIQMDGSDFNIDWIEIRPSGSTAPPPAPSTSVVTAYDEGLASDWSDWSWTTSNDLNATTWVKVGNYALDANLGPWGGVSLRKGSDLSTAGYNSIKFWVYGGTGSDKALRVAIQTSDTGGTGPAYTFTARAYTWTEVTAPLSALGSPSSIKRISIQEGSGSSQPTITFDWIRLSQ